MWSKDMNAPILSLQVELMFSQNRYITSLSPLRGPNLPGDINLSPSRKATMLLAPAPMDLRPLLAESVQV